MWTEADPGPAELPGSCSRVGMNVLLLGSQGARGAPRAAPVQGSVLPHTAGAQSPKTLARTHNPTCRLSEAGWERRFTFGTRKSADSCQKLKSGTRDSFSINSEISFLAIMNLEFTSAQ